MPQICFIDYFNILGCILADSDFCGPFAAKAFIAQPESLQLQVEHPT
jgi:hypothetical protein